MTDTLARAQPRAAETEASTPATTRGALADRLLDTQSPQRPQSTPRIRIEVDGRVVEGFEGQTILEVCRDNGIEIPTLCYEPKLPGFGACRMCVVEVEGEEHPPISCSRTCEPDMKVQTQTEEIRRLRRTNLELIFSDHNAYCLPPCQNKCPSHNASRPAPLTEKVREPHRHPGLPQGQRRGQLPRVGPDLQAHDPVPVRARPCLPRPARGALPAQLRRRDDR